MPSLSFNIPISLYIHMPWCVQKCPYCDFNSHALKNTLPEKAYLTALLDDLSLHCAALKNRSISSIFFGGGTPSLFAPENIATLLTEIKKRVNCIPGLEITLEANPGTVEQQRFVGLAQAGINRLSLGIQSLQDAKLKYLGRIHNAAEAQHAIQAAKQAKFKNINADLMFGLPQQSITEALNDLNQLIHLTPTHISWYQLTLEPNTLFYKHPPPLPNDNLVWEMQQKGQALLAQAGFQQYEVSAYTKPGLSCQHNLNYWRFGDYLGIGAGAHSKLSDPTTDTITRTTKHKHPKIYLQGKDNFILETKKLNHADITFEFMLNALRLYQAIPLDLFYQRTGLNFTVIAKPIDKACAKGLLEVKQDCIETTAHGKRFLNDLVSLFL